jgi:hypothetical protein
MAEELEQQAEAMRLPVGNFIELVLMEQLDSYGRAALPEE